MSDFDINIELLEICKYFKEKVSIKTNYIEYISALLYLKFEGRLNEGFNKIYEQRDNYYIADLIDKNLEELRNITECSHLFLNIKFANIIVNRNIGEKSPLKNIIERIYFLDKRLNDNSQEIVAKAYEYVLEECVKNKEIVRENEFYTPSCITNLMVNLINNDFKNIYDPFCGTGNFLISANKKMKIKTFGNENNSSIYNICMTNLFLHNIDNKNIFYNEDYANNILGKFDAILSNIPFSQKNWMDKISLDDRRFISSFDLPLRAVGDYAYVLRMLNQLDAKGIMAVVLPQGVLFRKNERQVRRKLLPYIDAIIGLPENLFFATRIEVIILVLKKNINRNEILFIDASKEFVSARKCNIILEKTQDKIVDTYLKRKEIKDFSKLVSFKEIEENNFDLLIKKYFKKEIKNVSVEKQSILDEIKALEEENLILEANIKDVLEVLNVYNEPRKKDDSLSLKKIIGQNLKKIRLEKSFTINEFAEYLSISSKYYASIERGCVNLTIDYVESICQKLDVSIVEILSN